MLFALEDGTLALASARRGVVNAVLTRAFNRAGVVKADWLFMGGAARGCILWLWLDAGANPDVAFPLRGFKGDWAMAPGV